MRLNHQTFLNRQLQIKNFKRYRKNSIKSSEHCTTRTSANRRGKIKIYLLKHAIWNHFKISKQEYNSRNDSEMIQILTRFYADLEAVYFGNGKKISCCKHCVWVDDGYAQDCLRCRVNVVWCDCSSDDELFSDIDLSSFSCISH